MLPGSNGPDNFAVSYIIADDERLADAQIYVIAPPPMACHRMTGEYYVPVKRCSDFAGALLALARRRHFYFIDLYHLLVDSEGYLPGKYDAGDGFHLSSRPIPC